MNYKLTAPAGVSGEIFLPASKSLSNRALLLQALAGGEDGVTGAAVCDDTMAMAHALSTDSDVIDVGAAGTAMRFLTAFFATREGRTVTLDGSERMRQRPIGVLVNALRALGADITYLNNEGFPPLLIKGKRLAGTRLILAGNVSSQYVSALLMIAPVVGGITLELTGDIVSRPYIDMTLGMMRLYGVEGQFEGNVIIIPSGHYEVCRFEVEADWSAASYWLALQAVLPQSQIVLKGLHRHSLQGDSFVARQFEQLGVRCEWHGDDLVPHTAPHCACCTHFDLSATPDVAQTLAVALCLRGVPFRLTGLRTLRIKETDRLNALQTELAKLGFVVKVEGDDALSWNLETAPPCPTPHIATYNDHRMAMAFAPAAARFPGLVIEDAEVVSKSYPQFWLHLRKAGFTIEEETL